MSLCALCGLATSDTGICSHHFGPYGEGTDWATGNRIMCDFVHRGIVPPTPPALVEHTRELLLAVLEEPVAA